MTKSRIPALLGGNMGAIAYLLQPFRCPPFPDGTELTLFGLRPGSPTSGDALRDNDRTILDWVMLLARKAGVV